MNKVDIITMLIGILLLIVLIIWSNNINDSEVSSYEESEQYIEPIM